MFWFPLVRQNMKLAKTKLLGATNYGLLPYAASYIFPYSVNQAACKRKESKSQHCLQPAPDGILRHYLLHVGPQLRFSFLTQTHKHFHAYFINHLATDLNGVKQIAHKHNSKSLPS